MRSMPASTGRSLCELPTLPYSPPDEVELPAAYGFSSETIREVSPMEWWTTVMAGILNSPYRSFSSRVNDGSRATLRKPFDSIPSVCMKNLDQKNYYMPGVLRDVPISPGRYGKKNYERGGQKHEDVLYVPFRVIDLDVPKDKGGNIIGKCATQLHIKFISGLIPGCPMILSNGLQIYLTASEPWSVEALMLAQIGSYLAKVIAGCLSELEYDSSTHIKGKGTAADHENHAYRAPWGVGINGIVRCFVGVNGRIPTVREVFDMLGLTLPQVDEKIEEVKEEEMNDKRGTKPASSTIKGTGRKSQSGSKAAQTQEFLEICNCLTQLVKGSGLSRADAEREVLGMTWEHHSRSGLSENIGSIKLFGDGSRIPDKEWNAVCEDLKETLFNLGPVSTKRNLCQRTKTIRALRAWSFEILYYEKDINREEAIEAFFYRQEFATIRRLSICALGEEKVREDLAECWDRWWHPDYRNTPYKKMSDVSPKTLNMVKYWASKLGTFTLAKLKKQMIRFSERQLRSALALLAKDGTVKPIGGNKNRKYQFMNNPNPKPRKSPSNVIVPPINGKIVNDRSFVEVSPPDMGSLVAPPPKKKREARGFPPAELYQDPEIRKHEFAVKEIFNLHSLAVLKKRLKLVSGLWCEANSVSDPDQAALRSLQIETSWLGDVVKDKETAAWMVKEKDKKAQRAAETPDEREARVALERVARAKRMAGWKNRKKWEGITNLVTRFVEEAEREGEPVSDQEVWEYRRNLIKCWDQKPVTADELRAAINAPPVVSPAEQTRRENMCVYFQKRIDSGADLPLADGETLLDRVKRFDVKRAEAKMKVA